MIRRELSYFFLALGYFTRLPVPAWVGYSADAQAASARYFPALGWVVGGLSAGVFWLALRIWPESIAVALAVLAGIYLTGGFHEDGLSDTADGLGGGWDKARILEIMKDSRVGSYGVLALWSALTLKTLTLVELVAHGLPLVLLAGHVVSRFCALLLMAGLEYARSDASSKAGAVAHRLGSGKVLFGLAFVLPCLAFLPWPAALAGIFLALLLSAVLAAKFKRWLGGYTGDCLGAVQQVSEIGFYLGVLAGWGL